MRRYASLPWARLSTYFFLAFAGGFVYPTIALAVEPVPTAVTLPVEVLWPTGSIKTVSVNLPAAVSPTSITKLWLKMHSLDNEKKASVRVNGGAWLPLNSQTVTLEGLAAAYGGIGGGFHTFDLTVNLPAGAVQAGVNTISFRYDASDSAGITYRVLGMNFLQADGRKTIPSEQFVQEDPSLWKPPYPGAEDIAEGKRLFQNADLAVNSQNPKIMRARCGNCHTQDGRDLKYFNFTSEAIRISAITHGLTAKQGDQIASYIRSLPYPSPGRPWNPPYQPGTGLDSKPVSEWAAGAGIDAVLKSDTEMLNNMLGTGLLAPKFASTGDINARETPIALQMPDWKHWLPRIHPLDAWGDEFANSDLYKKYFQIRASMKPHDANYPNYFYPWNVYWNNLMWAKIGASGPRPVWTAEHTQNVYSTALWKLVRHWEIFQEFELEGINQAAAKSSMAEPRGWLSGWPFAVSPNMLWIPRGAPGLNNGSSNTHIYLSYIWYHLQLLLNNSNKKQVGNGPIDWGYVYGFVSHMSLYNSKPQTGIMTLWQITALQIMENGSTPSTGWRIDLTFPDRYTNQAYLTLFDDTTPSMRKTIVEENLRAWFAKVKTFAPDEFRKLVPIGVPFPQRPDGTLVDRLYYTIPRMKYYGVDPTLIDEVVNWAKLTWPSYAGWDLLKTSTCDTRLLHCTPTD